MKITLEQVKKLGTGEIISYEGREALEAVKKCGDSLRFVKNQTPEICLEAVKQDGYALRYVDPSVFEEEKHEQTTPEQILEEAKEILKDRGKLYGDNYHQTGKIVSTLLNNEKIDEKAATKLFLITQITNKLTRYCQNLERGHKDSLIDLINYTAILAILDK